MQNEQSESLSKSSTVEKYKTDLPECTPCNLFQFEAVFLTKEQVERCEQMFCNCVKSSNGIYLAWKALKVATLPTEAEAVNNVLDSHSPSNIQKQKVPSGRKVSTGLGWLNPTSKE